jgi:hypothetical protein
MATQVKHRRGTNSEILAGTPAVGELWFNTNDSSIHMGDGVTPGGIKHLNKNLGVTRVDSLADLPAVVIGNRVSVTGYYAGTTVGGGEFVGGVGRHNGVTLFDPTRSAEIGTAAYYVDSGVDADVWGRIGVEYVTPEMAGSVLGEADSWNSIQSMFNASKSIRMGGDYNVKRQLTVRFGTHIDCATPVTINGNFVDFDTTDGTATLFVGSSDYSSIPDLSANVSKGDLNVTFVTDHGLSVGDVFCIYNPTDYSWASFRPDYRAGEFCRVSQVISATEVLLDTGLYADYLAASVDCYSMDMGSFSVSGSLTCIAGATAVVSARSGVFLSQLLDSEISGLTGKALDGAYSGITARRCFNTRLTNATGIQEKLSTIQGDYGLSIASCQHFYASGYFSASRHALTHGGFGATTDVNCRDCTTEGNFHTNFEGGIQAVDCHANCEDIVIRGVAYGGVNLSGSAAKFDGTIYGDPTGLCVLFSDVVAFNHDISGVKCITDLDPNALAGGRAVVDFGGNSTVDDADMLGGTMNFSGLTIEAPNAVKGVQIKTRATSTLPTSKRNIDLTNAELNISSAGGSAPINISDTSASLNFNIVELTGIQFIGDLPIVINTDNLILYETKARESYTVNTGISTVTVPVIFPRKYPSGVTPAVAASLQNHNLGQTTGIGVQLITNTGFQAVIFTYGGANFGVNNTYDFDYNAY